MEGYSIGQRVWHGGRIGTVRYIGELHRPGSKTENASILVDTKITTKTWLGIEWDDNQCGNHSGEFDGKVYFKCKAGSTGSSGASFVAPGKVDRGISFIEAVNRRHTTPGMSEELLALVDGKTGKTKQIMFVGQQEATEHFQSLEVLTSLTLDSSKISSAGTTKLNLANVETLSLDANLLSEFGEVLVIISSMPKLINLNLAHNHIICNSGSNSSHKSCTGSPTSPQYPHLETLVLNETFMDLFEVFKLGEFFPNLTQLHLVGNDIRDHENDSSGDSTSCVECCIKRYEEYSISTDLTQARAPTTILKQLECLDIGNNLIANWSTIFTILKLIPSIRSLFLQGNLLGDMIASEDVFPQVAHLSIDDNRVASWETMCAVETLFPKLKTFRWQGNPLYEVIKSNTTKDGDKLSQKPIATTKSSGKSKTTEVNAEEKLGMCSPIVSFNRQIAISIFPTVHTLNGGPISVNERTHGERYFLLLASQSHPAIKEACGSLEINKHPNVQRLMEQHGSLEFGKGSHQDNTSQTIASMLLEVVLTPACARAYHIEPKLKKLPTSMSIKDIKIMAGKLFKIPPLQIRLSFSYKLMPIAMDMDVEDATLGSYNIPDKCIIYIKDATEDRFS